MGDWLVPSAVRARGAAALARAFEETGIRPGTSTSLPATCRVSTSPSTWGGAHVASHVAFGPTIGAALNATLLSYDGTCFVGITTDEAAVPDTDVLTTHLAEGFDEVLELAGHGGAHAPPPAGRFVPGREARLSRGVVAAR